MTAQFPDNVVYADTEWVLAGANGDGLFEPSAHGIITRMASTACWRGFVCRYALTDAALSLDELHVAVDGPAPSLLGHAPDSPRLNVGFTAAYRDLAIPVLFSGGMLLARNFIRDLYVHMGFHPAWKYEHVVEAEFDQGRLLRAQDCSSEMAQIRDKLSGRDAPERGASREDIKVWVERAFSRKY
jgi:hypothetical protein